MDNTKCFHLVTHSFKELSQKIGTSNIRYLFHFVNTQNENILHTLSFS